MKEKGGSAQISDEWARKQSPCGCHAVNIAQPVNFCPKHAAVDELLLAATFVRNRLLQSTDSNWQEEIDKLNNVIALAENQ